MGLSKNCYRLPKSLRVKLSPNGFNLSPDDGRTKKRRTTREGLPPCAVGGRPEEEAAFSAKHWLCMLAKRTHCWLECNSSLLLWCLTKGGRISEKRDGAAEGRIQMSQKATGKYSLACIHDDFFVPAVAPEWCRGYDGGVSVLKLSSPRGARCRRLRRCWVNHRSKSGFYVPRMWMFTTTFRKVRLGKAPRKLGPGYLVAN